MCEGAVTPSLPRRLGYALLTTKGEQDMRSILLTAAAAVMMSATAALADNKSDCQKGVAMIKAELKKKHSAPVLVTLRKALSDAETEGDRGGLVRVRGPHQDRARRTEQVSTAPNE